MKDKNKISFRTFFNSKISNKSKFFLYIVILLQLFLILLFIIFLVPHRTGFYGVDSEYNRKGLIVRKIISLGYITKSIISSTKLKLGLIKTDLNIQIKPSDYSELMNLRSKAYEIKKKSNYELSETNTNNDKFKKYFKGNFVSSNQNVEGELRLKGDMHDHYTKSKWSMRIKSKNDLILGMKSFNLQHPKRRAYLSSYIMHLFTKYEDLPTKKIGILTVSVNNNPLGLYMYEEIPTKDAYFNSYGIEKLPIFLNDDIYMDEGLHKNFQMHNEYLTADISTYNENTILSNPILKNDFENASDLFNNLRRKKIKALDVFDKKTASFLAIVDLFGGGHTIGFNSRFYYDRTTKKLTPTLWDAFSENIANVGGINYGGGDRNFSLNKEHREGLLNDLFRDKEFLKLYLEKFNQISNHKYINKVFEFYKQDINAYIEKLLPFYPQASLDTELNRLKQNVVYLNKTYFNVNQPIIVYRSSVDFNNNLTIVNRKPYPVYVNKLINKKNNKRFNILTNDNSKLIEGKHYGDISKPVEVRFNCPKKNCFENNNLKDFEVLITKMGQKVPQLIKIKNHKFNLRVN
tara:strand:+ start:203 stop:1927 length:1725 start_codon:yes stop_codon:yes gene_type:complete